MEKKDKKMSEKIGKYINLNALDNNLAANMSGHDTSTIWENVFDVHYDTVEQAGKKTQLVISKPVPMNNVLIINKDKK